MLGTSRAIVNADHFNVQFAIVTPSYPSTRIRPLIVLRDAGILFGLTFVGGVIVGTTFPIFAHVSAPPIAVGISNILCSIIGFIVAGLLTVDGRWKHLWLVVLIYWLGSLVNVFFLGITVVQWILAGLVIVITMGIGGGVSALFRKARPNQSSDPNLSSVKPAAEPPPLP